MVDDTLIDTSFYIWVLMVTLAFILEFWYVSSISYNIEGRSLSFHSGAFQELTPYLKS